MQNVVYDYVAKIPRGKVVTYGQVARATGTSARAIGRILHRNVDPENVPCHRVVFADGSLSKSYAFGGIKKQREKLMNEGLRFLNNKILLK